MRFPILATLCLALGACKSAPIPAPQDPIPGGQYPAVTLHPGLQEGLVVDYERIIYDAPMETNPASVEVPVRSTAKKPLYTQYMVLWYDDEGRFVRESGWRRQTFPVGIERVLKANAIDDRAEKWRMEIRPAR